MSETMPVAPLTTPRTMGGDVDQEMNDATSAHPPLLPIAAIGTQTALGGVPPGLAFHRTTNSPMKKGHKRKGGQADDLRAPIGTPAKKSNQPSSTPPPQPASAPNPALAVTPPAQLPDTPTPKARADHSTAMSAPVPQHASDLFNDGTAPTSNAEHERQAARARRHAEKWAAQIPVGFEPPAGLNITPTPLGGFPCIHGITSVDLRKNVDAESLALWGELDDADYCLAFLAFDGPKTDTAANAQRIKDLIKQIFDCPRLIVSSPGSRAATREDRKPITPYLITGLDRDNIEILVRRACWSTPSLTFFTFPSTYFLTGFVMTLRGFSFFDPERAHEAAASRVGRAIQADLAVRKVVCAYSDNYPGYTPDEVLAAIADTIEAQEIETVIEGTTVTEYNIYMSGPTNNYVGFREWLAAVRTASYTALEGRAKAQHVYNCALCRGLDHPTGLCPFPFVKGWPVTKQTTRGSEKDDGYNIRSTFPGRSGSSRGQQDGLHRGRGNGTRGRGGRGRF
ncbi:hypothetical protein BJ912DRAFT_923846 [Pholiota molesta]|nr:hypothetical protein BJ912DRAFT_923846 [Pholiota molesta]